MSEEHELVGLINKYRNGNYKEEKECKKYLFKQLEDIKDTKGVIKEKRSGFLVYSQEMLNKDHHLYKRFEHVYNNCKGFSIDNDDNMKENNIYRYYYFEELYPEDKQSKKKKHATVIMLNPAFADSKEPDKSIKNIKEYLKKLDIGEKFSSFDIVNLYPIRMPKSGCLTCFIPYLKLEDDKNYRKFLIDFLSTSSTNTLIAAWGDEYNAKAKEIFASNLGFQFKSYKKGAPAHFSPQRYNNVKDKGLYNFPYLLPTELDA